MNNDIQEPICSKEIHTLLKLKGFDVTHWNVEPTHALAIEWIRVNFNLLIKYSSFMGIESDWRTLKLGTFSYGYSIGGANEEKYIELYNKSIISKQDFNTPHEAIESGLLYTLKELIK